MQKEQKEKEALMKRLQQLEGKEEVKADASEGGYDDDGFEEPEMKSQDGAGAKSGAALSQGKKSVGKVGS